MPVEPLPCPPGGGGTTEGCCSPSISAAPLCLADGTPVLLVLRAACADCGGDTEPQVAGWIDPATGVFTPGPAPDGAGPCPTGCASTTVLRLCDRTPDGECVPFWRHLVRDCDGTVTATVDTGPDGTTPYSPAGEAVDCADCRPCEPEPMCPGFVGLTGPEEWTIPPGTESVHLSVACGPVTVYPCAGATDGVQINECGVSLDWAAPGTGCRPGVLCEDFRISVPEGSAVYVSWLSAGCGDES